CDRRDGWVVTPLTLLEKQFYVPFGDNRRYNRMAYDKVLELGSGSCSPPPKTTDTPLTRCCCRTTTETQDNETAILSKWRTSHTVRLPKFFNVTRQTSGDCHHDFRLGFLGGRKLKRSAPDF